MSGPSDPLSRIKPLADPLWRFIWLSVGVAVFLLLFNLLFSRGLWITALSASCRLLALIVLVAPNGRPNAIYLRAFRTDTSTAGLRLRLAAILGPHFRLSGIRPPRKKTPLLLRILLPYWFALRYAGSTYMELEAGDDWMARLWKTYQKTRLVFIDVRDVTSYVHQEIQMTLDSVGVERCVFLVDGAKPPELWRQTVAAIAGERADPTQFHLLDVDSAQMAAELNGIVKALPAGAAGASERGRQFVVDHTTDQQLKRGRLASFWTFISVAVVVLLLPLWPLIWGPVDLILRPLGSVSAAVVVPLAILALPIYRKLRGSWQLARFGHWFSAAFGIVLVAFAGVLSTLPEVGVANLVQIQREHEEKLFPLIPPPTPPAPPAEGFGVNKPPAARQTPAKGLDNAARSTAATGDAAPVQRSASGKVKIPASVAADMLIEKTTPIYPPIAKMAHVSGTVVLAVTISGQGTVEDVSVLSGPEMLKGAAIDAVKRWRYKPYLLDNQPVKVETTVKVKFGDGDETEQNPE